ncbi:uncharacterized protein LOC106165999 [Lingula anatina]|uniref:Uncharacterized protein LOC106165999 n=1 Tax=Lingula anatina TaxID=7574 RepID=A0A1S3INM9_LINAN|nr:uncharacterized protein LOC106165999 [Lingula anatina]XP_013399851.1 uncharacterized protein LOC106165999 [Lingula anatina]|eukprot:XP_013399850.1 uncharacterized protein LOC106165999 [Lingula anatina]
MEETEVPPTLFTSKYMNEAKFRNLREQRKLDQKIHKIEDEKEMKAGKLGMQRRFLNLELKEMRRNGHQRAICPMGLSAEQKDAYKTLQNHHLPSISLEEFDRRLTSFRLERETTNKWKQKIIARARNARMHQFRKVQNPPSNESESKKPTPLLANIITKLRVMKQEGEQIHTDDEHDQEDHGEFDFDIKIKTSRSAPTSPARTISFPKPRFQFTRAATVFGVSLTDTPRKRTRPLKNNAGKFGMAVTQSNVLDLTPHPKERNSSDLEVFHHQGKCVSLPDLVSRVTHIVHAWNAFRVPLHEPEEPLRDTLVQREEPKLMEPPLPGSAWKNFNVFNRTLNSLADAEAEDHEVKKTS